MLTPTESKTAGADIAVMKRPVLSLDLDDWDNDDDDDIFDYTDDEDTDTDDSENDNDTNSDTDWVNELLGETARIGRELEGERRELIYASEIPSRLDPITGGVSQWVTGDVIKRRRSPIRPGEGGSMPALFYGYPAELDSRPPVLVEPGRAVYVTGGGRAAGDDVWDEVSAQWASVRPSTQGKPKNDRVAKELREHMGVDERDVDMLFFLSRFRNVAPVVLAYLVDVPVADVIVRLRQFVRAGVVVESMAMGGPLYSLTSHGFKAIDVPAIPLREQRQQLFNHNSVVLVLAALAERGEFNPFVENGEVPFLRPMPVLWNGRTPRAAGAWGGAAGTVEELDGMRRGFRCISETELASAFASWKKRHELGQEEAFVRAGEEMNAWDGSGLSPELRRGNEHLLMVQDGVSWEEHAPDLVIKQPRNADGSPASMCVEVELNAKKDGADYYARKFSAILGSGRFGSVHYFTPSKSVANVIRKGADAAVEAGVEGVIAVHEVSPTFGGKAFFHRR